MQEVIEHKLKHVSCNNPFRSTTMRSPDSLSKVADRFLQNRLVSFYRIRMADLDLTSDRFGHSHDLQPLV